MSSGALNPLKSRIILFFLLLAAAWLLWSGLYKPLLIGLGAVSCLLTFAIVRRMGYFDNNLFALRFSWRLLGFWCWLAREVLRSSLEVARVVLDPRLPISPRVVEIESTSPHPFDQVLLGNSITLTPGTLTLDLHKGMLRVHTLTEAGASDLMSGEMDRRVAGLNKG